MDLLLIAIALCIVFSFLYLMRVNLKPDLSSKAKLLAAVAALVATGSFLVLVRRMHPSGKGIYLPTLDLVLKEWAIPVVLLIGAGESLFFLISAIVSGATGDAATARRAAAVLELEPRQTEALVYIYVHKRMTLDDFRRLCPEADSSSLEQDLQALVKLGLMVPKGDEFVMT